MTEVTRGDYGWYVKVGPFNSLADAAQFVAVIDGVRIDEPVELPALQVNVSDMIDITTEMK